MKTLRHGIRDYLELRRGLGFKLVVDERHLCAFALFLEQRKTSRITTQLALEFATERQHLDCGSWVQRMCAVRAFAQYWKGLDPTGEIPPAGLLRCPKKRARPRFCSDQEIIQILDTARTAQATQTHGLRPWTLYALFGLLAVTGMRISESINLRADDIDWRQGIITVRNTKFGKSRLARIDHKRRRNLGTNYA
jgi:integrase